jgi:hypothetical protein
VDEARFFDSTPQKMEEAMIARAALFAGIALAVPAFAGPSDTANTSDAFRQAMEERDATTNLTQRRAACARMAQIEQIRKRAVRGYVRRCARE